LGYRRPGAARYKRDVHKEEPAMSLSSTVVAICLMLLVGLCLSCGGSSDNAPAAPETSSAKAAVDSAVDSATDAAEEAVADADATIDTIKAELAKKEAELEQVTEQIKGLSPQDAMSDAGQELKKKSTALTEEIQGLKDKLDSMME
jgi:hypothetical protein